VVIEAIAAKCMVKPSIIQFIKNFCNAVE